MNQKLRFAQAFSLALVCVLTNVHASEIIFRPGPGLNNGTDSGAVAAGKDASGDGNGNYGAWTTLFALPISTCNPSTAATWVRFDVSTLPSDVTRVFVGFTHVPHTTYCYSNCNADFYFYPITSAWDEMTVTYPSRPSRGAAVLGPINITFPNDFGTREYDITDMYRQWKNNPSTNFGFEISSPTQGCNNAAVAFLTHSSDATTESQRPYLRIQAVDAPVTPASVPTLSAVGLGLLGLALAAGAWWRRRSD